jgi:hypothetical protein
VGVAVRAVQRNNTMNRCACAINEVLISIMKDRVKLECINMSNAGASIPRSNEALADYILPYYENWRANMLERAMDALGDPDMLALSDMPITTLSRLPQRSNCVGGTYTKGVSSASRMRRSPL